VTIVAPSRQFIFVKTRKTAGTSIQESFLPFSQPGDVVTREWTDLVSRRRCAIEEFASLDQIQNDLGVEPSAFFKFGFTRNPFSITLSRYFYQLKMKRVLGNPSPEHFNLWVQTVYFVGEPRFPGGRYLLDRSRHLLFDQHGRKLVDFIGRFEQIQDDFQEIVHRIGLPEMVLVHVNKSNKENIHYRDWFDSRSRRFVEENFDFELSTFGYQYSGEEG
jgi:hypothetical protein